MELINPMDNEGRVLDAEFDALLVELEELEAAIQRNPLRKVETCLRQTHAQGSAANWLSDRLLRAINFAPLLDPVPLLDQLAIARKRL